jgi:hypothetical protein
MHANETAKEFLRNRWALRRNQPWTPIQCFGLSLNTDLSDACQLHLGSAGAAEGRDPPSAVSVSNQE